MILWNIYNNLNWWVLFLVPMLTFCFKTDPVILRFRRIYLRDSKWSEGKYIQHNRFIIKLSKWLHTSTPSLKNGIKCNMPFFALLLAEYLVNSGRNIFLYLSQLLPNCFYPPSISVPRCWLTFCNGQGSNISTTFCFSFQ